MQGNFVSKPSNFELLDHDKTIELIQHAQKGSEEAKDMLVRHNIALVKSIVKRFINRGFDYEDLVQVGCIGLIKAINNFDISIGVKFSTYAVPMVMGEIKRYLRDNNMIKVSRSLKEKAKIILIAEDRLKNEYNREPTISEIAEFTGLEKEEIVCAIEANSTPRSIYETVFNDDGSPILLIDQIGDDKQANDETIDRIALKDIIVSLNPRERQVIFMRYFKDKTQTQIAEVLGISQVQVSRIEKKVLEKMRHMLS
ncbi:MAG: RNA polymerase sporulation sigma factor SigF [Clostridia bacterium]|nr:RNA polymerase sporulation sigma factor SigF [Clostridia bacterium]